MKSFGLLPAAMVLASCATMEPGGRNLPARSHYVAMGSSFAAGPGIAPAADQPPNRCSRSAGNYAHHLARLLDIRLIDVSCSGATTEHILGPWNELPAQIDAITSDTKLVTITIGGNDVGYIGRLLGSSCQDSTGGPIREQIMAACKALIARGGNSDPAARGRAMALPDQAVWEALAARMRRINAQIQSRAPQARIIYVNYVSILPPTGALCPEVPLLEESAAIARNTAATLESLTRDVARRDGVEVLDAAALSRDHHACSADPWSTGFVPRPGVPRSAPYHPNEGGMKAIAMALSARLKK